MKAEVRTCSLCEGGFEIQKEDCAILEKLGAPLPKLCAECALQRRFTYRNERHLYHRKCELCRKPLLAMYDPVSYAHVYCRECWYSDTWNPMEYGQEYDSGRSFKKQFFELMQKVPHFNLWQVGENQNAAYTNYSFGVKDCYLVFSCIASEGCLYGKNVDFSKDCADCYNAVKSELLYECVDVNESYHSAYLIRCTKCVDCYLCRDCKDCQNCFGSVNLRHKQYYWYNQPLKKQEYEQRLTKAIDSRYSFAKHLKKFETHAMKYPVEYAYIRSSEDATGDYLINCSQTRHVFDAYETENAGSGYRILRQKDSYRESYSGQGQMGYENISGPNRINSVSTVFCHDSSSVAYSHSCFDCNDLLGCVGLRKKRYCILNKQYTKIEYEKLQEQIISAMRKRGEWGEFFAVSNSPHAYNDTLAQEFRPLTKKRATKQGWRWNDDQGGKWKQETLKPKDVPITTSGGARSITKEILACVDCGRNYRIEKREFDILRSLRMALPLRCQECRFRERLKLHNMPPLHHRQCMCDYKVYENDSKHKHHETGRCPNKFETTYAPERKEIVYCEECYREEVV